MVKRQSQNEVEPVAVLNGSLIHSSRHHPIERTPGILIVGHGSRRAEANDDVRGVTRRIGERGGFTLIEAAFLEIEHPTIAEGFARLVERGAREIVVHPYFLSPGRHTRGDLPREVEHAAARYPQIAYRITEPLSAHSLVVDAAIERILESSDDYTANEYRAKAQPGKVYLVGAGPGEPRLLTLRAHDLLASCDLVLYDYLVDPEILDFTPLSTERIPVGKIGRGRCTPQTEINRLLIEAAHCGRRVVRLKGGDPFLFGRGGEEAEALYHAGIPFEVVPGVSSALAVPAYAGIPLTHRDYSSSVAVLTGSHSVDGGCNLKGLAGVAAAETIVILMGFRHLGEITSRLISLGREPDTPAAVIRWGTYDAQQTVTATLASIAERTAQAGLRAPVVVVIGEVVRLRARVAWFDKERAEHREWAVALTAV